MFKSATVAEIEAEATRFQAEVGDQFTVNPNSYGIHIRCNVCQEAATHDRGYAFGRNHKHTVQVPNRVADYRKETVNADGTRNVFLGWA